jgi:HprK-related kinase A
MTLTVESLGEADFRSRLCGAGIGLRFGPFDIHLRVTVQAIFADLYKLYRDVPVLDHQRVFSGHLAMLLAPTRSQPRVRKVRVLVDGVPPHEDMPEAHALPVLEWALNLVIALRHQAYLMLHSATVERSGAAMLLPASPGHGKTTLCAALVHRGWRLLSDEFGLVRPDTAYAIPVPRLMPLKNDSIDVIRGFAPDAYIGPAIPGTKKGTVAHVRPPRESVDRANHNAPVRAIVFPRWMPGARLAMEPVPKGEAFMQLAMNAFNYEPLGLGAFRTVQGLVEAASCHRLVYSNLDQAEAALTKLLPGSGS